MFVALIASVAGTSVASVALTVLVFRRTGSPFLSSLSFAFGFLPFLFGAGLLSGVIDRFPPRRLLTVCDLVSAGLVALIALTSLPVAALLAIVFGMGVFSSIANGTRNGLVPAIVPEAAYVPARSLLRVASQTAQIGGNALGGLLVAVVAPTGAILLNSACLTFSALTVRLVLADHQPMGAATGSHMLRDSLAGAKTVFAQPEVRRLLLMGSLVPMFAVAPEALAAPYVVRHHGSSTLVGIWLVALPLGVILGNIVGVKLLTPSAQRVVMVPVAAAGFLPYVVFIIDPMLVIALPLLVVAGVCSLYSLGLDARLLAASPAPVFPRTMMLNTAVLVTMQGLGFAVAGAIAQGTGPAIAIAVAGVGGLIAVALTRPPRRPKQGPAPRGVLVRTPEHLPSEGHGQ